MLNAASACCGIAEESFVFVGRVLLCCAFPVFVLPVPLGRYGWRAYICMLHPCSSGMPFSHAVCTHTPCYGHLTSYNFILVATNY